jgi:lysophospholipase L1-like esterase
MGDSITDGWPSADPEFFSDNNFVGRGISGQVSSQMLLRFRQDVIDLHPKYVVILAGTNDIAENSGKIDMEKTFGNIVSMCDLAKANGIKPIICSVIPAVAFYWHPHVTGAAEKIAQLNAMLEAYAKANKIKYVDYHSVMKDDRGGLPENLAKDGVHPTREGYDIMKNLLLKALH